LNGFRFEAGSGFNGMGVSHQFEHGDVGLVVTVCVGVPEVDSVSGHQFKDAQPFVWTDTHTTLGFSGQQPVIALFQIRAEEMVKIQGLDHGFEPVPDGAGYQDECVALGRMIIHSFQDIGCQSKSKKAAISMGSL
jgi:hypothetical protein